MLPLSLLWFLPYWEKGTRYWTMKMDTAIRPTAW